ncbi:hypothetical protein SLS62_005292 [Diatrype stigma]|uniref:TAFII55 protein conserved region domain-containing protein n=1 Tax=Diatrype stigma TaxID=117547 RepID=A0AAN9UV40_9PEZI
MASTNGKPALKLNTNQNMPPPPTTAATPASENPRPILKLNTSSRQPSFSGDSVPTPSGEKKMIKIKISSQPSTPAATPTSKPPPSSVTKTKAGRPSKPTAKLIESKKRGYESDEDRPMAVVRSESGRPNKILKIKPPTKPGPVTPGGGASVSSIKFKPRGEPVEHHAGDAYDSEASDREVDPTREQAFILRVFPGAPVEYLRKAIAAGTIGLSKQNGGADFNVQFVDGKERRAMITIDGIHYAAVLVSLPTITEAMKTWDRKTMMKNSDVVEMLMCFAEVRNEMEAKTVPLPAMVVKNEHKWPHGLTPPMHDAANRRFRRTISEKQWQSTAAQVKKLMDEDHAALESSTEWIEQDDGYGDSDDNEDADADADADADMDAEGEPQGDSYFPRQQSDEDMDAEGDDDDDDVLAAMEADLEHEPEANEGDPDSATPVTQMEAPTPMTVDATTPAAVQEELASEEEEDEDEEGDISEEDEDEEDEDRMTAEKERKEKLADLHNYEAQVRKTQDEIAAQVNPILKKRLLTRIDNLKKEIAIKKAALGFQVED